MDSWREFHGPNAGYVLELYDRYRTDPTSVDSTTAAFFDRWTPPDEDHLLPAPATSAPAALDKLVATLKLAHDIRAQDKIGYNYPHWWNGVFYPSDLPQRRWLQLVCPIF